MEIIGTNTNQEDLKTKKIMKFIIVLIVILLIISIGLFAAINYLESQEKKFIIDGANKTYSDEIFYMDSEKLYISIKDISPLIGYTYYNGGYKQYSEDITKCYLASENEICTFQNESNTITKINVLTEQNETFVIEEPVKMINNKLYITAQGLNIACNLNMTYTKNKVQIETLQYLVDYYVKEYKYTAVENNFNNQKAILYDLLIVQNEDNTLSEYSDNIRYGITNLKTGEEVVGLKYINIEFIESTQEFIVTTAENKVGIITASGITKIMPKYEILKQINKELDLYLVEQNGKQGIIDGNENIVLYIEYDQIGINSEKFNDKTNINTYMIYDELIPVKKNDKWGICNINGKIIIPIENDTIGYMSNAKEQNSVIIIPEINAIVMGKNTTIEENKKENRYGIVSSTGKELVTYSLEKVYYTIENGKKEYWMEYAGNTYNVVDIIEENL